jgi:hypothetical protein
MKSGGAFFQHQRQGSDLGISCRIGETRFQSSRQGPDRRPPIVGELASALGHIGQFVMHVGGTIDRFIDATFAVPTRSEAYKYAAYDGVQRLARRSAGRSVTHRNGRKAITFISRVKGSGTTSSGVVIRLLAMHSGRGLLPDEHDLSDC